MGLWTKRVSTPKSYHGLSADHFLCFIQKFMYSRVLFTSRLLQGDPDIMLELDSLPEEPTSM